MIHVTLMWRLLIRQGSFPWIDDVVDLVDAYGSLLLAEPELL
jgi:hypothetical protein